MSASPAAAMASASWLRPCMASNAGQVEPDPVGVGRVGGLDLAQEPLGLGELAPLHEQEGQVQGGGRRDLGISGGRGLPEGPLGPARSPCSWEVTPM